MDASKIVAIIGLLVALSAASERVVEIIKNSLSPLAKRLCKITNDEPLTENLASVKSACLQILAVAAGILTAWLAYPAIPADLLPSTTPAGTILALGLLASGGSGLWNSALTYVLEVKNVKSELASVLSAKAEAAKNLKEATKTTNPNALQSAEALAKL